MVSKVPCDSVVAGLVDDHYPAMRRMGITLSDFKGVRELTRWRALNPTELAALNAEIAASLSISADIDVPVPRGLAYLGYQKAGIAYAFRRPNTLIADEMGLGKTVQLIGLINLDPSIKKVLIICPASLRINWRRELNRWLAREMTIGIADTKSWPGDAITVIGYEGAVKSIDKIGAAKWDLVAFDEGHYLKNPSSARTKALFGYWDNSAKINVGGIDARRKVILTGTPFENRTIELFGLINYLAPHEFPSRFSYAKRYCNAHQKKIGWDRAKKKDILAWDFSGSSQLDELQQRLRAICLVRRKKSDVLKDLPPKRRCVVELMVDGAGDVVAREKDAFREYEARLADMGKGDDGGREGAAEYKKTIAELGAKSEATKVDLFKARHETARLKLPAVVSYLEDIAETDPLHKVIVFCHHRDIAESCAAPFKERAVLFMGGMGDDHRDRCVQSFQRDANVQFFVVTLDAGATGLTLTASAHVIFAEFPWDPAKLGQAEDRAHRIGQRESVLVEHLVLAGSIDVQMVQDIIEKQGKLDQVLDNPTDFTGAKVSIPGVEILGAASPKSFTPGQNAAVHVSIRQLAGTGLGVLRPVDGYIIRKLGSVETLVDSQVSLGRKLLRRYRKLVDPGDYQLAMDMITADPSEPFDQGPVVTVTGTQVAFAF